METHKTLYSPEKEKEHLILTNEQKDNVRNITLGIEEVDEAIRSMAVEDVITTLENGHPLNRIIADQEKNVNGYVACEDFVSSEAYIKYLGTTKKTGRNLFQEIPDFLEYAKQQGYTKLNFHGWNKRLNHIMERYGFKRLRTDAMGEFSVDFYEKALIEQKTSEAVNEERKKAFEQKYLNKVNREYQETLKTFSEENKSKKEKEISDTFQSLSVRLSSTDGFEFGDRQKSVLKLKLARYFQKNNSVDSNTIFDAIIETPKFLSSDKGSLFRLFEVHEQKTLEKIAEIRKQRAEMGGTEAFNPYENLFTTKSGDYYMARLLNMPHLEQESEYMNHCVGTSDSYVNKMRRGEVEIFSFRHAPKINPITHQSEGDIPVMTIEYNRQANTIEQMKKHSDEYLKKDDPYFNDVIDALKQLRTTPTDTGELRDFSKISSSELENIKVEDYHVLTEKGEVSFRDFDPDSGVFVLKTGEMEITPDMPKSDVAKIIRIVENIKCNPDEIALKKEEINKNTKIYIGEFFVGLFQSNIENIYSSFPEGKISKFEMTVGGKTKEKLLNELEDRKKLTETDKDKIYVSDYVEDMLKNNDFEKSFYENTDAPREQWILKKSETANFVKLKIGDLGFPNGATTDEIYQKAEELGLELCPAETGLDLRLHYKDIFNKEQPLGEYFRVAMKQIAGRDGYPYVFSVNRSDGGKAWLRTYSASPDYRWSSDTEFVFRFRKLES